jgi:uncharacterized protein
MAEAPILDGDELDLERLGMRSGEGRRLRLRLAPADPVVGGQAYPVADPEVLATVVVSRTTSGYALQLLAAVPLAGPCARCLGEAELALAIDSREVDQRGGSDPELTSPYVEDGILDVAGWLADSIRLGLPEKVLCRADCAGICDVCGASLNDVEPGSHQHRRPPDPRFAKLRDLLE